VFDEFSEQYREQLAAQQAESDRFTAQKKLQHANQAKLLADYELKLATGEATKAVPE